jgi:transcriptional regulator with XRE-family HTH domain
MSFGERMKQAREQLGLSRIELAEKLHVTKSAISNYENGVSSPKEDVLLKIFDALGVDPNFLFQDSFAKEKAIPRYSEDDLKILAAYSALDERGKATVRETIAHQARLSDEHSAAVAADIAATATTMDFNRMGAKK